MPRLALPMPARPGAVYGFLTWPARADISRLRTCPKSSALSGGLSALLPGFVVPFRAGLVGCCSRLAVWLLVFGIVRHPDSCRWRDGSTCRRKHEAPPSGSAAAGREWSAEPTGRSGVAISRLRVAGFCLPGVDAGLHSGIRRHVPASGRSAPHGVPGGRASPIRMDARHRSANRMRGPSKNLRVLVVDDKPLVSMLLLDIIENAGCASASGASNLDEAAQIARAGRMAGGAGSREAVCSGETRVGAARCRARRRGTVWAAGLSVYQIRDPADRGRESEGETCRKLPNFIAPG